MIERRNLQDAGSMFVHEGLVEVNKKTVEYINYQIWSLLSGFCNSPTDLATSFKSVGRMMGLQLGSRKETLLDISTFLRHLIAGNRGLILSWLCQGSTSSPAPTGRLQGLLSTFSRSLELPHQS